MPSKSRFRGVYGRRYQQARARLLENDPPCYWCGEPATTADHEPPLEQCSEPHMNLVPACKSCNYGRRGRTIQRDFPPSRQW